MKEKRSNNRRVLLLIAIVFLVPPALAWWFLHFSDYVDTGKKSNYGLLIVPARPLPLLTVASAAGDAPDRALDGKWSLFYVLPGHCGDRCKKTLYSLNQIEQAMGKNTLRVQRVALLADPDVVSAPEWYPGQWLLRLEEAALPSFLDLLKLESGDDDPLHAGHVYIIDPQGALIMRYERDFDPYHIIRDLKKLLKASHIG